MREFYEAVRAGLYSDFNVIVGDKSYPLHKFVLAAKSRFFAGLFRVTPNETCVVFEADHLVSRSRDIWEHLVRDWYLLEWNSLDQDEIQPTHDPEDFFRVQDRLDGLMDYFCVTEMPRQPIIFRGIIGDERERNFLPDLRVTCTHDPEGGCFLTFALGEESRTLRGRKWATGRHHDMDTCEAFLSDYIEAQMGRKGLVTSVYFYTDSPFSPGTGAHVNGVSLNWDKIGQENGSTDLTDEFLSAFWSSLLLDYGGRD